jgi:putative ABC transport system substrate-binding protein
MFLCWLTLGTLSAPLDAEAQPAGKISRVGYLGSGLPSRFPHLLEAFPQGLRDVGYTEGRNIVIEYRWAKEQPARLPDLAAELVRLHVAVIVAADQEATRAARGVTTRIPIVTVGRDDSAWVALIANLIWPGRHVTGPSSAMPAWFGGKWVELLTETVPRLSRIAFFWNPANRASALRLQDAQRVSRARSVQFQPVEVRRPDELDAAFAGSIAGRASAFILDADPIMHDHAKRIVGLVERTRRPAISGWRVFVDAGGLMSCGQNLADPLRQAGRDAGKLLKGAKPADLPVEQSTDFELVIDLKTAKALGLTIPPSVLLRADEVIQ